jgi:hypothetical protein
MGASQANTEFESVGKGPAPEPESHASLIDTFREREIEVVHSHEYTMAAFGTAAAKLSRLPHFITLHGGTCWARRWRRRPALRRTIRQSQGVNVVSEPYRKEVSGLLGIPKGAATSSFKWGFRASLGTVCLSAASSAWRVTRS